MSLKKDRMQCHDQAAAIVSKMSLEEKVYLMSGQTPVSEMRKSMLTPGEHYNWKPYPAGGNERLDVPKLLFCDGPRGVVCGTGRSTCFPVSMSRGATFDVDLEERIGEAIGRETRAFGGNFFGGVCVNIPYHPGWGRAQETYGEDPCHVGAMGAALVRGVQKHNVVACVKHFAFNSMELARFQVDVQCDKRVEREVFTPQFKDCIDAGAAAVMTAYNAYDGTKCGHHNYLINTLLKGEWGFDGIVMSDFNHGVKDTVEAVKGGMDVEMAHTKYYGGQLVKAVEDGFVPAEAIDETAIRIVRTLLAFTRAEDSRDYGGELIGCKEHIALALEAAEKSITLLKNEGGLLPLSGNKARRIAVLGQLADDDNIGDHGSSQVHPPYVVRILEGIKKRAGNIELVYEPGTDLAQARDAAVQSDAVVIVAGCRHYDEGEYISFRAEDAYAENGGDRGSLRLRGEEVELIRAAAAVNPNIIVVLIGGSTILMDEWEREAAAILFAYYPGMEGGTALASILFGDKNPGGRLPFVIPKSEAELPPIDWDANRQYYGAYHGYTKLDKEGVEPLYPFGYGLSYTSFVCEDGEFSSDGRSVSASCTVRNTGQTDGEHVVQMYIGFGKCSVERPVKLLSGFARVFVEAGESRRVTVSCPVERLKWYNHQRFCRELSHMEYEVFIGGSSAGRDLLKGTVNL